MCFQRLSEVKPDYIERYTACCKGLESCSGPQGIQVSPGPSGSRTLSRRVRLIRKVGDYLNGIDLSAHAVGDVLDMPPLDAELLIAEGWAIPEYTARAAHDRRGGAERRHREQSSNAAPATAPLRVRHSADHLREQRVDKEQRQRARDEQRRAENSIREELQDSRAKTIAPEPPED